MENQNSISDPNQVIEELDKNADRIIFKYSLIASLTNLLSFIPGSKAIVDVVGDTLAQYKMLNELSTNYKVDKSSLDIVKIIAIVADNFLAKKLASWAVDFIPFVGKYISTLMDFAYTFAMGHVFKELFRESYLKKQPVEYSRIPDICVKVWKDALDYIKKNWKGILGSQKLILETYEVDLAKITDEFKTSDIKKDDAMIKNIAVLKQIYQELKLQRITTAEFFDSLKEIEDQISTPSSELIKARVLMAQQKGEDVDPDLLALLELLDKNEFLKIIKKLLPPDSQSPLKNN